MASREVSLPLPHRPVVVYSERLGLARPSHSRTRHLVADTNARYDAAVLWRLARLKFVDGDCHEAAF